MIFFVLFYMTAFFFFLRYQLISLKCETFNSQKSNRHLTGKFSEGSLHVEQV